MTNKQYFKDEVVRVSNTYMSADGTQTVETPKPAEWDSTKTKNWLTGLTTGFNVFNPVQQPYGDIAIVDGTYTFELNNDYGGRDSVPARFTFVLRKINGGWKIATHHSSAQPE